MEEKRYNGIQLLTAIKEDTIKDNTILRVLNKEETICYILIKNKQIKWNNTFNTGMLIDDNYTYEIVDIEEIREVLNKLSDYVKGIDNIIKYTVKVLFNISM